MTRRLRRNDIVCSNKEGGYWSSFGRIVRRIDDGHVEVITCTKHIETYADEDLDLHNDYKGRWDDRGGLREEFPIFYPMPTLRKLKQMASYYHDDVWKKPKPAMRATAHRKSIEEALHAPWTERQVELINLFQTDGQWMSETCDNHYDDDHKEAHNAYHEKVGTRNRGQMIATREGLHCPVCGFTQTYAHRYMLLGDFKSDK